MKRTITISFALWAIAFFGAFVAFMLTPASDFGLSRGWNKVGVFMQWQFVATGIAIFTLIAGREAPKGSGLKWLSRAPILVALLLMVLFAAIVFITNAPPAQPHTPPEGARMPTKPADTAPPTQPVTP